jgi:hypothetical protein
LRCGTSFARVPKILDLELAQFLASQRMEQQRRENGAVAFALDCVVRRRVLKLATSSAENPKFNNAADTRPDAREGPPSRLWALSK